MCLQGCAEQLLLSALVSHFAPPDGAAAAAAAAGSPTSRALSLWHSHDELREALISLLLKDIALASYVFGQMHAVAPELLSPEETAVLSAVTMPEFVATWSGADSLGEAVAMSPRGGRATATASGLHLDLALC